MRAAGVHVPREWHDTLTAVGWTVRTAKGPDGTRGFSDDYQKGRGRLVRSLSSDAIEFVPFGGSY